MMGKNHKILIQIGILIFSILVFIPSAQAAPSVSSRYCCLVDSTTGQMIFSRGAEEIRPVASTTKMMTAILAVEYCQLDEMATVSEFADRTPEFTIGLRKGQVVSVEELLKVALLRSSNDAAVVLGEHIAGEERLFGHLMTRKAFLIGAYNTHFVNASGLPANDHYSTAYDIAQIGRYLLKKPYLSSLVAAQQAEFKHPDYQQALTIYNTNGLLSSYQGADGIKTGTTDAAGKCLAASATRNGRQLIAVVLNSGDRYGDCRRLLDYGFLKTNLVTVLDGNTVFKEIKVLKGRNKESVALYPRDTVELWQGEGTPNIEKKVTLKYWLEAPIPQGQKVGRVDIYADGRFFQSTDIICGQNVERELNLIMRLLRDIFFQKTSKAPK
ncbi:MAG: D-alanyl-D-alanine carboxypeptidase family protein [Syntrophomonadaceae bacterium]|jgi:D-alanyl-D-alanine carboxypeptidase (penicillin-binding protein 5/6)